MPIYQLLLEQLVGTIINSRLCIGYAIIYIN
jgi:hypothetical protein